MKIYYTFGTDERYPYQGGWVEVEAPSMKEAHRAFRSQYPDRIAGRLNCADYYTARIFAGTRMAKEGNFGAFCHRRLRYRDLVASGALSIEDGHAN